MLESQNKKERGVGQHLNGKEHLLHKHEDQSLEHSTHITDLESNNTCSSIFEASGAPLASVHAHTEGKTQISKYFFKKMNKM